MSGKRIKKRRLGTTEGSITRRRAERPDHVWSIDFIFDRNENGRPLKSLSLIDDFTGECIALEVNRKFTGDDLVDLLSDLFAIRGVPKFIRSDNGPEFIGRRVRQFLEKINVGAFYIEPGSLWQNGYVESFHSRIRDECLACEVFTTLTEARTVIAAWRQVYNHRRPHSSLGGHTPADFSSQWSACVRATPSLQKPTAIPVTQSILSNGGPKSWGMPKAHLLINNNSLPACSQ